MSSLYAICCADGKRCYGLEVIYDNLEDAERFLPTVEANNPRCAPHTVQEYRPVQTAVWAVHYSYYPGDANIVGVYATKEAAEAAATGPCHSVEEFTIEGAV